MFLEFITIFFIRDQSPLKWRKNSKYKVPPIPESIIFFSSPKFLKSQRIVIVIKPILYTCLCIYLFKESNVTLISTNNKQIGNLCYFFFLTGLSSQMSTTGLNLCSAFNTCDKIFFSVEMQKFLLLPEFFHSNDLYLDGQHDFAPVMVFLYVYYCLSITTGGNDYLLYVSVWEGFIGGK